MSNYVHKNEVILTGRVIAAPVYSHSNHEEQFYKFPFRILRLSGQADELSLIISASLLERCPVSEGMRLNVTGQLRSYNNRSGTGSRLVISVFVRTLCPAPDDGEDRNEIVLCGILCKHPQRRNTPLGRDICDLMLAVNRPYGRADYIPCIAWGALSAETSRFSVGDPLAFEGRVQSRTYQKLTESGPQQRTAYEVSIMCLTPPPEFPPVQCATFEPDSEDVSQEQNNEGAYFIVK